MFNARNMYFWVGAIGSIIWLVVGIAVIACNWKTLEPNQWGDVFAGLAAPMAFLWLVLGFLQQGDELRVSTDALKLQAEELRNSVEQQKQLIAATQKQAETTKQQAAQALAASTAATRTLIRVERAYLTGGGDIEMRGGRKCFRVDVANYGKTGAYLTHYEIRFAAKLADVQAEPRKVYEPQKQYVFDDRIASDNKTKVIGYEEVDPPNAEIIYGCFWYTDWRRKKERYFRFILRVDMTGRTKPDVKGVDESYRHWN